MNILFSSLIYAIAVFIVFFAVFYFISFRNKKEELKNLLFWSAIVSISVVLIDLFLNK